LAPATYCTTRTLAIHSIALAINSSVHTPANMTNLAMHALARVTKEPHHAIYNQCDLFSHMRSNAQD